MHHRYLMLSIRYYLMLCDYDYELRKRWALERQREAAAHARRLKIQSAALASNPYYAFNRDFDKKLQDLGAMAKELEQFIDARMHEVQTHSASRT
jgi:hypothetical protein